MTDAAHDPIVIVGTTCTTVNKMWGSGMKTVMMAYEALYARPKDILVAGGMESMTTRGVAALCIGGGEATAVAVERLA